MKNFWRTVITLLLFGTIGVITTACESAPPSTDPIPSIPGTQEFPGVFDDQKSTVYIKTTWNQDNMDYWGKDDPRIAEIMKRKQEWENRFPTKRVVSISVISTDGGGHGHTVVGGLLMHYETRQEQTIAK